MDNIVEQLTRLYLIVDDLLKRTPGGAEWRRSPNCQPRFSDAEVISIALLKPALGLSHFKSAYELVAANAGECFPQLCGYKQWMRRLQALNQHLAAMLASVAEWGLAGQSSCQQPITAVVDPLTAEVSQQWMIETESELSTHLYLIDSKPLPVVQQQRIVQARLLRDDGAGFAKSSRGWFFGFKLHVLQHYASGIIVNAMLTPGNYDDRGALSMCEVIAPGAYLIADEGYNGHEVFDALASDWGIIRVMPSDVSGTTQPGQKRRFNFTFISAVRQRIETTFSQWWRWFIDRVLARCWQGLWSNALLTMLFHNLRQTRLLPP